MKIENGLELVPLLVWSTFASRGAALPDRRPQERACRVFCRAEQREVCGSLLDFGLHQNIMVQEWTVHYLGLRLSASSPEVYARAKDGVYFVLDVDEKEYGRLPSSCLGARGLGVPELANVPDLGLKLTDPEVQHGQAVFVPLYPSVTIAKGQPFTVNVYYPPEFDQVESDWFRLTIYLVGERLRSML